MVCFGNSICFLTLFLFSLTIAKDVGNTKELEKIFANFLGDLIERSEAQSIMVKKVGPLRGNSFFKTLANKKHDDTKSIVILINNGAHKFGWPKLNDYIGFRNKSNSKKEKDKNKPNVGKYEPNCGESEEIEDFDLLETRRSKKKKKKKKKKNKKKKKKKDSDDSSKSSGQVSGEESGGKKDCFPECVSFCRIACWMSVSYICKTFVCSPFNKDLFKKKCRFQCLLDHNTKDSDFE